VYALLGFSLVVAGQPGHGPASHRYLEARTDCLVQCVALWGKGMNVDLLSERLAQIKHRIASVQQAPEEVTVVAVTKGFGADAVSAAASVGLLDIGENYAKDLLAKLPGAPAQVRWHFLGAVQRNKVARLAPFIRLWHGVDGDGGVAALATRSPGAEVLIEVKVQDGPGRHGVEPSAVPALVDRAVAAGLSVKGLMTVGPRTGGPEAVRRCFRDVARLAGSLGVDELSMGMSEDFELAVAEGATIVRLGRVLFGERPRADAYGPGAATLR
jgi:uncharacterized pyridoxal phosphate-containing UPF0001 family protein